MPDAFDALRDRGGPIEPDSAFAATLRARLERALALPEGVAPMTDVAIEPQPEVDATVEPTGAAVPYLAVDDARRALDWYVDVFGARIVGEPIVMPDGRVGHAELALAGGVLYLADAHPEIGVAAPRPGEASVSLMLAVDDADAVRERAVAAGASGDRPPYDGYGRRNAWIVDPFGHRWGLNSPLSTANAQTTPAYRHGDPNHIAFVVPDVERARSFYADVLGWSYLPDGRVDGSTPSVGFRATGDAGDTVTQMTCTYAVTDIEGALERVRDAGGAPGAIERYPWGTVAECADDQGTPIRLFEVPSGAAAAPPQHGAADGDLSYLTLEIVDSARARAFYGSVLGWTFTPGRIEDGWQVDDIAPMTGLSGGHERATAVPMWRVPDIAAAVAKVRDNGGTATEPEQQPYGITSDCRDDQGVRFYLGQL